MKLDQVKVGDEIAVGKIDGSYIRVEKIAKVTPTQIVVERNGKRYRRENGKPVDGVGDFARIATDEDRRAVAKLKADKERAEQEAKERREIRERERSEWLADIVNRIKAAGHAESVSILRRACEEWGTQ